MNRLDYITWCERTLHEVIAAHELMLVINDTDAIYMLRFVRGVDRTNRCLLKTLRILRNGLVGSPEVSVGRTPGPPREFFFSPLLFGQAMCPRRES